MRFDTVIIGGGLAGLTAGICLQQEGRSCAIVSTGQNALHFFSGTFESVETPSPRLADLFAQAGIPVHYSPGVRLMPLGTFRPAALSLGDVTLSESPKFAHKVLIVNFLGYQDFFTSFLAEGLEKEGMSCRIATLDLPETEKIMSSPSEMRSVQIARVMDRSWEKAVQEVRILLKDEDTVILPQVFGLHDSSVPERIRQGIPARVVFVGTLPPSVPGIRTQQQLKRRFEVLGGTYLSGDEVLHAHLHEGIIHSVVTKNLGSHYLEADHFVLATGGFFSKGLKANPFRISEPVFGLDVRQTEDRSGWYRPDFSDEQPYLQFGVETDADLHPLLGGSPVRNLFAIGSVLGGTRPEFGTGAGLALRSALAAADRILNTQKDAA